MPTALSVMEIEHGAFAQIEEEADVDSAPVIEISQSMNRLPLRKTGRIIR